MIGNPGTLDLILEDTLRSVGARMQLSSGPSVFTPILTRAARFPQLRRGTTGSVKKLAKVEE